MSAIVREARDILKRLILCVIDKATARLLTTVHIRRRASHPPQLPFRGLGQPELRGYALFIPGVARRFIVTGSRGGMNPCGLKPRSFARRDALPNVVGTSRSKQSRGQTAPLHSRNGEGLCELGIVCREWGMRCRRGVRRGCSVSGLRQRPRL